MTLPHMCIAKLGGPDYSFELGRGVFFFTHVLERARGQTTCSGNKEYLNVFISEVSLLILNKLTVYYIYLLPEQIQSEHSSSERGVTCKVSLFLK